MSVDILPGICAGEGQLVRRHADDFSILEVQLYDPVDYIAAKSLVNLGKAACSCEFRPRKTGEGVEEEVVDID